MESNISSDLLGLPCLCHIKAEIYIRQLEMSLKFQGKPRARDGGWACQLGAVEVDGHSQGKYED